VTGTRSTPPQTTIAGPLVVAIGPSSFAESDRQPLERLRQAGVEIRGNPFARKLTEAETIEHLKGVHGLLAGLEPLNRRVLTTARTTLKAVARVGIGMDNVDVEAARELNIHVSNTPDGPTEAVAEMTVAALLALARRIPESNSSMHAGQWKKLIGFGLRGSKVLLVGFGRIGRRVAELLHTFGMEILVTDPNLGRLPAVPDYCRAVTLTDGLALADVVSLHASGDAVLLGTGELARLKPGAVVLNASRGTLIDEAALLDGLRGGRIAGAWLDVYASEPYAGPLRDLPQVLLTPHVSTYTRQCRLSMELQAVDNLLRDLTQVRA
jgi:D-3-phosphoglycerate dehydrogenase / 2-oxoglutarate reductase